LRRLDDDVLEVDEPAHPQPGQRPRPRRPRPRPRQRASDRLGFRPGIPRGPLFLPLAAGLAVLALLLVTGFVLGGPAKANRFALGPIKFGKLKVKTFDEPEFAIRFRYPQSFNQVQVRIGSSAGARPAAQRAIGLKGDNVIILTRYNLQRRVTGDNLDEVKPEADKLFSRLAGKDLKGKVTSVGGLPALEYQPFDLRRPAQAQSRLLVLFDGVTEYLINCQSLPDQRKQVTSACDLVRSSMERL
jgi:hypothetical protein